MKELIYSCSWEKDKKNSWSGTPYSLFKALSNFYVIQEFDYGASHFYNKVDKIFSHLGIRDSMRVGLIQHYSKIFKKKYYKSKNDVFQFEECPNVAFGKNYLYVDMIVGYLKYLMDSDSVLFQYTGFSNRKKHLLKREKLQTEYLNNINVTILTMGKWQAKWICENYPLYQNRVYAVGGGYNINPEKIKYNEKSGNKILFIGKDFERKNGPLVIESFKKAKKVKEDLELYIIGPPIVENSSKDGIHFLGELSFKEIPFYFNMCDIFCMPSKYEAYGLVFPEALTYGLPCIGKNMFEMPYFIEDGVTGFLIENDSAEECAKAIINLIDNNKIKANVQKKREYYLYEYNWNTVAERIFNIIG